MADALSRSKRVELDAIHIMMTEGDQAEKIAMMTRSSIVATEEVNIWRTKPELVEEQGEEEVSACSNSEEGFADRS